MGPLSGFRVIELAGIGPGPFCGMMLSDMGAEVIRVDRIAPGAKAPKDVLARNRRSIGVNLKSPEGVETVLKLVESADALFEGFRPGVTERLGLGPEECMARNPKLVYGRMTGWGQDGPMAQAAGHDINYIGLAGALHAIGRKGERPVPPLNLVGDFGGGGMLLAFGVVCALLEAQNSGKGQVVDAAMVDGAASLMAMFFSFAAGGGFTDQRGTNTLDGGAHFYDTYETGDGKYICLGSIEPQFYQLLVEKSGVDAERFAPQMDAVRWPDLKAELTRVFKMKTRDEWCEIMEGTDVCFAPVLSIFEAPTHPHNAARQTFVEVDGVMQPAPSPRFSRTEPGISHGAQAPGTDTEAVLADYGFDPDQIAALQESGAVTG
ncbi:MAG: CaiB/BaiF CoA-transferase family protein [Pseudomonadales bacterium]|jgi:alpha-methylacyl-CoA racemase|nr:CaiB/BaiF CoA-transferase family protein [Pseudomonadales bacterium]MDP6470976.1 CaiB/BaiF CoA-transferase family protein [Pseudomonadales bacterium]MDP6825839.1 CaiB/BaiF CoA-transferase family protein [Pseudomonadales bacterium]MDP6972441.1 CaiB/BaiF CoA-transferase family protein [Pseudomonadales bacterium]